MILDVVHWSNETDGCHRCSRKASRYITPYWASNRRVCPTCCRELSRLYDSLRWPQIGRADKETP